MTIFPGDIAADVGGLYRHRRTGAVALLRAYFRGKSVRAVWLVGDDGFQWRGSPDDFWREWIHNDVPDANLN